MKFFTVVVFLAAVVAVAAAALPVEPMNAFMMHEANDQQYVVEERKPLQSNDHPPFHFFFTPQVHSMHT